MRTESDDKEDVSLQGCASNEKFFLILDDKEELKLHMTLLNQAGSQITVRKINEQKALYRY